jgi:selenide, water dikinase
MQDPAGPFLDLLLLGGGHAHLGVLRAFGMRPEPGLRLSLLTRETMATYSGMVPGVVAGLYPPEAAMLDLRDLARKAGARLIQAEAEGLDLVRRCVLMKGRPPPRWDLLSLDVGAAPRLEVPGAAEHVVPVWPLDGMLRRLTEAVATAPKRIAVVGGGAGGVELALALRTRLGNGPDIALFTGPVLLPGHGAAARRLALRLLHERGVAVRPAAVARVEAGKLILEDGVAHRAGLILWATGAAPIPWLRDSGLALDGQGFLALLPTLQSASHAQVFAAGDCATVLAHPRPKAGVYAVRQGMPLAENLRRAARGEPPRHVTPQRRALALLNGGDGTAIASWDGLAARGRWAWHWKQRIDARWMERLRAPLPSDAAPYGCRTEASRPTPWPERAKAPD